MLSANLFAHGIDGCISGNLMGGFTGYDRGNRIGIKQFYFSGSSQRTNFWGQEVTDYAKSGATFVSGNFSLSRRWSIMLNTSYYINYESLSGEVSNEFGWGDSRAVASYAFHVRVKDSTSFSRASISAGIELPTGKLSQNPVVGNFSTGSGSYDFPFSANYILSHRNKGFKASGFYLLNGRNPQFSFPYKYGNAGGLTLSIFKNFVVGNWQYSLAAGPSVLYSGDDVYEHEPEHFVISNGYAAAFAQGEFAVRHRAWALNTALSIPVYTARAEELYDQFRWLEVGLSYNLGNSH